MEEHRRDKYASPESKAGKFSSPGKKHVDRRSWKLIADPALGRGQEKLYRFDGVLPGNPVPVLTRDPRFRLNRLKLKDGPLDLPLPNLKLDEHFIGKLPPRDVTFTGLNDNINESFLTDMCRPYGDIETLEIFTHPRSGRHLGIARVLYCSVKPARLCVERLNNTLKMGKTIQACLDTGGKIRAKLIADIVNEVKPVALMPTEHVEMDVKTAKVTESKLDERSSKSNTQESDGGSQRRQSAASLKSAGLSSSTRRQSPHQQLTSKHSEAVSAPQQIVYPPPPPLIIRQSTNSLLASSDPDLISTSEPEFVINAAVSPQSFDKEEGEIGSEDSEVTESSEEDDGEEAESLEQRIQALLTGNDNKNKDKEVKSATPNNRSDQSRVTTDAKSKPQFNFVENTPNVAPPVVPQSSVVEQIVPFPFSVPPPPPPSFALPPGIRPPPSAIFVTKDQHGAFFTSAFEMLVAELRRTLYRDLCRRLLEQCAFRHLDSWWVKNEIRSRAAKKPIEESSSLQPSSQPPTSEQKPISQNETHSSVLSNGAVENDGWEKIFRQGGVFGLRDTLPKLPSFRRKDPQPPPPRKSTVEEPSLSQKERARNNSESGSDNSVADFPTSPKHSDSNSASGYRSAEDKQKRQPNFKRKKVAISDSEEESSSASESSSESSSSSLDDFSSSSSEESEKSGEFSKKVDEEDKKRNVALKSPQNVLESSRSPQEGTNANFRTVNRPTSPTTTAKTMSSPITSPQKPKARWAMFLQEQEQQQQQTQQPQPPGMNKDATPVLSIGQSPAQEMETKQVKKQSQSEKGKSKTPKLKTNATAKGKMAQRIKKSKAQVEVPTSDSSESETSSAETDEKSETETKKGKKKSLAQARKVTPARRNVPQAKLRPGSTKSVAKEPLQQQQQPKISKPPMSTQPASPRKPVVKRVNTIVSTVKNEAGNDGGEECSENETVDRRDPHLPDFLVDHSYVPLSHLHILNPQQSFVVESDKLAVKPVAIFKPRDRDQEEAIATSFMRYGIDTEDLQYLERSYEELLQNYSQSYYWLNETHWVKHPPTALSANPIIENENSPRKKRRTANGGNGCARCDLEWRGGKVARPHGPAGTETVEVCETSVSKGGIDLLRASESGIVPPSGSLSLAGGSGAGTSNALERLGADIGKTTKAAKAELREARSHQRRLLACFSSGLAEEKRDILGFNLLKYRKKRVRFARSGIHGWGLYALEPIAAEEMVVEYAGELVRKTVGDLREKKYARLGVDGSYMFRVDEDLIVDATMAGNYGRFINHSCAPNCYAKVITVDGRKKIVIYSKREIAVSEEITYDYKFPLEPAANKIVCHCGAPTCRQTLN